MAETKAAEDPEHERIYQSKLKAHLAVRTNLREPDWSRVTARGRRSEEETTQLRLWLQSTCAPLLLKYRMLKHQGISLRLLCNLGSLRDLALFIRNDLGIDSLLVSFILWNRINEYKELCLMESVHTPGLLTDRVHGGPMPPGSPLGGSGVKRPSVSHRRTSSKMKDRSSFLKPRGSSSGFESFHERKSSSDSLGFSLSGHRRSSAIMKIGGGGKRRLTAKDESCVDILTELCGLIRDAGLKEWASKLVKANRHSQPALDSLYKVLTFFLEGGVYLTLGDLFEMVGSVSSRGKKSLHTRERESILSDRSIVDYEMDPFECDSVHSQRIDGGYDELERELWDMICDEMGLAPEERLWLRHEIAQSKVQAHSLRESALSGLSTEPTLADGPPMLPGSAIEIALRTAFNNPFSVADATGRSRSRLKATELCSMYTREFSESLADEFVDQVSGRMDRVEQLIHDLDLIRITFNGTDRKLINIGYRGVNPPKPGEEEKDDKDEDDTGGFGMYGMYGDDDETKEKPTLKVHMREDRTARAYEPRGKAEKYVRNHRELLPEMNLAELVDCLWEWEDTRNKLDGSVTGNDNTNSANSLTMNPEQIDELCPIRPRAALLRENPNWYPYGEIKGVTQEQHLNSMTLSGLGKFSGMARLYYGMLESMAAAKRQEHDIEEPAEEYTEQEQDEALEEMEQFLEYGTELGNIAKEWHKTKDEPRAATLRLDGRDLDSSSIDVAVGREAIIVPDSKEIDRSVDNATELSIEQLEKSVELARERQLAMARQLEKSRALLSELEKRARAVRGK